MENWRGRSLAFVRQAKGLPARYGSAKEAYAKCVVHQGSPPLGAIVWFEGGHWGDCALGLGERLILAIGVSDGKPYLTTIEKYYSPYLGWSDGWPDNDREMPHGDADDDRGVRATRLQRLLRDRRRQARTVASER